MAMGTSEFDRRGEDRIMAGCPCGRRVQAKGTTKAPWAAVFHCTPQFDGRGIRIAPRYKCAIGNQPTAGGSAEIRDQRFVGGQ